MDYVYTSKLSKNKCVYNTQLFLDCGKNVYVSGNVEIMRPWNVRLGDHVMIDSYFFCTTQLYISDYVHIGPHVSVCGGLKGICCMGPFSGMSAGCRIVCGSDDFVDGTGLRHPIVPDELKCKLTIEPVIFQPFVTLGVNVCVLPGVVLGIGSTVGANSLVTKNTEPWTLYAGSPARPLKMTPRDKILDNAAQLGYELRADGLYLEKVS